jgi:hypothetical protein
MLKARHVFSNTGNVTTGGFGFEEKDMRVGERRRKEGRRVQRTD